METSQNEDQIHRAQYRIPAELANWLKAKAKLNTRSLNGELIVMLKEARQQELQRGINAT